jgi:hypothetical protein
MTYNLHRGACELTTDILVLECAQTKEIYDCWLPGSSKFKAKGLLWGLLATDHVEKVYPNLTFIKQFESVADCKNWIAETYFVDLI